MAGQWLRCMARQGTVVLLAGARVRLPSCRPRRRQPRRRGHVLENKAIAASTAFMFAACLEHHVPPVRGS